MPINTPPKPKKTEDISEILRGVLSDGSNRSGQLARKLADACRDLASSNKTTADNAAINLELIKVRLKAILTSEHTISDKAAQEGAEAFIKAVREKSQQKNTGNGYVRI